MLSIVRHFDNIDWKAIKLLMQWRIQDLTLGGGVDFVNGGGEG